MLPSKELSFLTKWEAERALAYTEAEAYERERAIADIRLLMQRYGLTLEDIGAPSGPKDMQHSSECHGAVDQG